MVRVIWFSVDKAGVLQGLWLAASAYPLAGRIAALVNDYVTLTNPIIFGKTLWFGIRLQCVAGVYPLDSGIEIDPKLPIDFFGTVRHALINKVVSTATQYPALAANGITVTRSSKGNIHLDYARLDVQQATVANGELQLVVSPRI